MAYTKISKPLATYTRVNKSNNSFLLFQDNSYLLFQDNSKCIILDRPEDTYSKMAKTTASWSSVVKP